MEWDLTELGEEEEMRRNPLVNRRKELVRRNRDQSPSRCGGPGVLW